MNRFLLTALIVLASMFQTTAQIASGDSWAATKQKGSGTVNIVYYNTPGLIEKDPSGKITGMCTDLVQDFQQYIKTKYNKTVTFKYVKQETAWANFLSHVQKSGAGVLGVGNATITEERKKIFEFTPSYINNPMMFLTHNQVPSIKNYSEMPSVLAGFTAKVVKGSTHLAYMSALKKQHYPNLNITFGRSGVDIMHEIVANPKLFTIVDFTEFYYAIKKKLPIKRHSVSVSNTKEKLGMIMPKGSDWAPLWNEFLTVEYKNSMRYKEIITKNLGRQFTYLVE